MVLFCIAGLFLLSACTGGRSSKDKIEITGTEGLVMNFVPNNPRERVVVGENSEEIRFLIEARNKGTYSEGTTLDGSVFLSGFDPKIITFSGSNPETSTAIPMKSASGGESKFLERRSVLNPVGGYDIFEFVGTINGNNIKLEAYEPIFSATACYRYQTVAGAPVCIDPKPYDVRKDKVCAVQPIALSSQGAPIAVTSIEPEVVGKKYQYRITIKNVGGGDVVRAEPAKCNPHQPDTTLQLSRKDFDLVQFTEAKIQENPLTCRPLVNFEGDTKKYIRLIDGSAFIICTLDKQLIDTQTTAFTTPLEITLGYTYRNNIQRSIQIIKVKEDQSTGE